MFIESFEFKDVVILTTSSKVRTPDVVRVRCDRMYVKCTSILIWNISCLHDAPCDIDCVLSPCLLL